MNILAKHLDALAPMVADHPDIERISVVPGGIEIAMLRHTGEWQGLWSDVTVSWAELETDLVRVCLKITGELDKFDRAQGCQAAGIEIPDDLPQIVYLE